MNEIVLVVAPHPDDEIIGCGGAMLQHKRDGDRVFVIYITSGELFDDEVSYTASRKRRYNEAKEASKVIGFEILEFSNLPARRIKEKETEITDKIEMIFRKIMPTVVYLPHDNEKDSDHILVNEIVREAYFRSKLQRGNTINRVNARMLGYEVWTPIRDICDLVNLEDYVENKSAALNKYVSQLEGTNYTHGVQGLNNYRGTFFGSCMSAEVFTMIRI